MKESKKTVQDIKMEIETIKKRQIGGFLEMKKLRIQKGTTDASFSNRMQEMKQRIWGIEDHIEEMDTSVREKH